MGRARVDSVEAAVSAAEDLVRPGRRFIFRGQRRDWPVRSSRTRLTETELTPAEEQLGRYEAWLHQTPGLAALAADVDQALAVAQHYGLPTNFVDFTTAPRIAGFFASEKAEPNKKPEDACIVCLDVDDLLEFWEAMPAKYPPPEFLPLTVPDLWRLEAQRGCFLFCPYPNFEDIYDFDRIIFPNTHPLGGFRREDVYPSRKSHLEVLLDQFFMNERMIENARTREHPDNMRVVVFDTPPGRCDPDVFPNGIPGHVSWSAPQLRPWLELPAESYVSAQADVSWGVTLDARDALDPRSAGRTMASAARKHISSRTDARLRLINWHVRTEAGVGFPSDFEAQVGARLARLWDGLRRTPASDDDVSVGLGTCVAFAVALRGNFRSFDGGHWDRCAAACLEETIPIEIGCDDGSYSRSYVSSSELLAAVRPDIASFAAPQWASQINNNPRGIIQTAHDPRSVFDFRALAGVFARQIAPCQVVNRSIKDAVFYSPARLVSLGLP